MINTKADSTHAPDDRPTQVDGPLLLRKIDNGFYRRPDGLARRLLFIPLVSDATPAEEHPPTEKRAT
jgi:hypothetical protein